MKFLTAESPEKLLSHCARESGHSHFRTLKNKYEHATRAEATGRRGRTRIPRRRHDPRCRHRLHGECDARPARSMGTAVEGCGLEFRGVDGATEAARRPGVRPERGRFTRGV